MSETKPLIDRIQAARTEYKEKNGTEAKILMLGATELAEFVREFCPMVDDDPDSVQGTQTTMVFGLRLATVLKTTYLGVC